MKLLENRLGNTDLTVSSLGFGAASLGNLFNKVTNKEAQLTVAAALNAGIRLFDTAPRYGLGLSERRIGDALREIDRSKYVLSTKVGRLLKADKTANVEQLRYDFDTPMPFDAHYDYTYDGIMRSFEDSLQRMGLASIDILLVHDIGHYTHGDMDSHYYTQLTSSGIKALEELKHSGQIKAVGLGVNETEICERVMDIAQFDCFLLASRYSLLEQKALDTFLPKCVAHGASIILGAPYNSGILATGVKNVTSPLYEYLPAPEPIINKVSKIQDVCEQYAVNLAAAALQFPLAHPAVATVIPGIGSEQRLGTTVSLFTETIPAAFWETLKERNLISQHAPIPVEE